MNDFTSPIGTTIKDYKVRDCIGDGGFGAVYRAFQTTVKRDVAIKIIHPKYVHHPIFAQRFEAEARLIAQLEHIHIVPLHDYWRDSSGAYIVMRWLRGGNLRDLLKKGPLDLDTTARMLNQLASALHLAHRSSVVHRDLKPENILLDDAGNFYLSDFGIAKNLAVQSKVTPEGIIVGSPAYLAPEQIRQELITPQTDLYSLGIMLYEVLAGEQPFVGSSHDQLLYKHLTEPLPPIRLKRHDLPAGVGAVIERATAKEPAERFEDAPALARAFLEALTRSEVDVMPMNAGMSAERSSPAAIVLQGDVKAHIYSHAAAILEKPRRLIGRESLIESINWQLDEAERILLHGLGGVGKTSIAATVAADYIASGKGYAIWLEVGYADEGALFDAIARAFDQQQEIARLTGSERIAAVRNLLIDQRALLVLDNVWNGRALFQILKAVPTEMPVLVTSRHIMPIDGTVIHVGELEPEKAVEVLSYYARRDYRNDTSALALCRQLGNHPFALEIAGKRMKLNSHLSPADFMASIADAPHDLSLPADFAEVGRAGVRNLLDASIGELDADEQAVFMAMGSMLVSTATAELLSLALQRDVRQIDAVLNTMQQRGLVSLIPQTGSTPAHYRLHDLTYSYARARFAQHGGDRAPLIEAVQQFVEAHMEDYDVLEFEQHNILGAVQAAQYVDNNSALIDIIRILAVEGEYFAARGHTPTSLQLLKDAITAAKREKQSELAHYLLSKLGNAYREFYGDLDNAMRAYQEALELAPNETREAILLSVMGTTRFMQGGDDVTTFYERAEEIARTHYDTSALLVALQHRGYYAMKNEDYDSGRMLSDEAARIAEEMNSSQYHFMALMNRGECENLLGNYEQALATHQEAYELARLQNNHVWMAHALRDIGEDFHALGDRVQAQESLTGALKLWWQSEINAQAADLVSYMEEKQYVVPPQTQ